MRFLTTSRLLDLLREAKRAHLNPHVHATSLSLVLRHDGCHTITKADRTPEHDGFARVGLDCQVLGGDAPLALLVDLPTEAFLQAICESESPVDPTTAAREE